eukprot:108126-Pyramimonas_sp.AAC.1
MGSFTEGDIHNCGTHNCIWLGPSPDNFLPLSVGPREYKGEEERREEGQWERKKTGAGEGRMG